MTKIYLAGKMGGLTKNEATTWRNWVKDTYPMFDYLDPTEVEETSSQGIYDVMDCDHQSIYDKDIELLKQADIVLAKVDGGEFGTIWELGYADALGKDIMIVSELPSVYDHPFVVAARSNWVGWGSSFPHAMNQLLTIFPTNQRGGK